MVTQIRQVTGAMDGLEPGSFVVMVAVSAFVPEPHVPKSWKQESSREAGGRHKRGYYL